MNSRHFQSINVEIEHRIFPKSNIDYNVLLLEWSPQMLSLALQVIHWEAAIDEYGSSLFESLVNIPLAFWYLRFYSSPRTKNAVIGKLLMSFVSLAISRYSEYAEKYIYVEDCEVELNEGYMRENTEISHSKRCGLIYDSSKWLNVGIHHILYTIICPFVGMWETFNALKDAFIRDFK